MLDLVHGGPPRRPPACGGGGRDGVGDGSIVTIVQICTRLRTFREHFEVYANKDAAPSCGVLKKYRSVLPKLGARQIDA